MNKLTTATLTCLFCICIISLGRCNSVDKDELFNKYYKLFKIQDGTALLYFGTEFHSEVPESYRDDLLARIIDRSSKNPSDSIILQNVLSLLINDPETKALSPALTNSLLALVKHPDSQIRRELVLALSCKDKTKFQDAVASFLNDPEDDVRKATVLIISCWPDRKNILIEYRHAHGGDPSYAKSISSLDRLMPK